MKIIRKLGNAEYFYYLYNKLAPTNFVVIASLNINLEIKAISKSLNTLVNTYEIFGTKIVPVSSTQLAFCENPIQTIEPHEVIGPANMLNSIIAQEVNSPLKHDNEPLHITIFTENESKSQHLLFTFNHILTDAAAAVMMVQKTVAYALSGRVPLAVDQKAISLNLERMLPSSVRGLGFLRTAFSLVRRSVLIKRRDKKLQQRISGEYNFHSRSVYINRIRIQKQPSQNIRKLARNNRLTIHHILSAILAVIVRKQYEQKGKIPLTISMPVSLRKMLNPEIDFEVPGLYISVPKLNIPVSNDDHIVKVAKLIKTELQHVIHSKEVLILWNLLTRKKFPNTGEGLERMDMTFSKNADSAMITNLGVIPIIPELESKNLIRSLHFAVAPPKDALLCCAVSSYREEMVLNFCFNTDLLPKNNCQTLYQEFESELNEITKGY